MLAHSVYAGVIGTGIQVFAIGLVCAVDASGNLPAAADPAVAGVVFGARIGIVALTAIADRRAAAYPGGADVVFRARIGVVAGFCVVNFNADTQHMAGVVGTGVAVVTVLVDGAVYASGYRLN